MSRQAHIKRDNGFARFKRKIAAFDAALLPELGALMLGSIRDGSSLTGALGQPVEDGDLYRSWTMDQPTPHSVRVSSTSPYARMNEDGVRVGGKPYLQHSAKGGRHSLALTRVGLPRLVNEAAIRTAERARGVRD